MNNDRRLKYFFLVLITLRVTKSRLTFTQEDGVEGDSFTLDFGDNSQDFIDLKFGETSGVQLRFDTLNDNFILNRDLDLGDNEALNFRVENLTTADTCDSSVVGKTYFNTTDTNMYVCNGTLWEQIDAGPMGVITGVDSNTFTIDQDDTGGNVSLIFGNTLNESLLWDDGDQEFELSDDLNVSGDVCLNATKCLSKIGELMELTNTNLADINVLTGASVTFNLTSLHNTDPSLYTATAAGIEVAESGVYEAYTNIYMEASGARNNAAVEFTIDGTAQGIRSASGYVRRASGHNESSTSLQQILTLAAGEVVGVRGFQISSNGTVNVPAGQSNLILKRIK